MECNDFVVDITRDAIIDYYIGLYYNDWNCQIDHEDGSTAPFSSLALEEVCSKSFA